MKQAEIVVDEYYLAKVSDKMTTVKVLSVDRKQKMVRYRVLNIATNRETTFRSAAKFRSVAPRPNGESKKAEPKKTGQYRSPVPVTNPEKEKTIDVARTKAYAKGGKIR